MTTPNESPPAPASHPSPLPSPNPLLWGAAAPDSSTCWVQAGFKFESCCVPWQAEWVGTGNPSCWSQGFTYERCCKPRAVPRDIFRCHDRHAAWDRFRMHMALFRPLSTAGIQDVLWRSVDECLLGSIIAAAAQLQIEITLGDKSRLEKAYDRLNLIFKTLLRTPISMDEILASGWPVASTLLRLREHTWLLERAAASAGPLQYLIPGSEGARFGHAVWHSLLYGERMRSDLIVRFATSEEANADGMRAVAKASVAWAIARTLRNFEGPTASTGQRERLSDEAANLVEFGDSALRPFLLAAHEPLSVLFNLELPFLVLLEGLQYQPVVLADPLSLVRDSPDVPGLPRDVIPSSWAKAFDHAAEAVPPLELYVHPTDDSVSNNIRARRQPFCYDRGVYLRLIAMIGRHAERGILPINTRVRIWEVGANLGDCTLWAAAALFQPPQERADIDTEVKNATGVQLDAIGFEPIMKSAALFSRSASVLHDQQLQRLGPWAKDKQVRATIPRIRVRNLALGDRVGERTIGIPTHSLAESTFHHCCRDYGCNTTWTNGIGCHDVVVKTDTVDRILFREIARINTGRPSAFTDTSKARVDMLKIHVQGDELRVLRGAQQSLQKGIVCLVFLQVRLLGQNAENAESWATEVHTYLKGFQVILVSTREGAAVSLNMDIAYLKELYEVMQHQPLDWAPPRAEANTLSQSQRRYHMLVAWHTGPRCSQSPAVTSAIALWGYAVETNA